MIYLIAALVVLGVIAALTTLWPGNRGDDTVVQPTQSCSTCAGTSAACEQECMMEAATQPIEYFDDEELDAYAGRSADSYTDQEADEFYNVMTTMQPAEVQAWGRSLNLRGIELPNQIKDEFTLLVSDAHSAHSAHSAQIAHSAHKAHSSH